MMQSPAPQDIAALRMRHGLTQVEFAAMLGARERSVTAWEQRGGPSARNMPPGLWMLARILLGELSVADARRLLTGVRQGET